LETPLWLAKLRAVFKDYETNLTSKSFLTSGLEYCPEEVGSWT